MRRCSSTAVAALMPWPTRASSASLSRVSTSTLSTAVPAMPAPMNPAPTIPSRRTCRGATLGRGAGVAPLGPPPRRPLAHQLVRRCQGRGAEDTLRHQLIDQSEAIRLLASLALAGQDDVEPRAEPDEAGQALGAAGA